VNRKAVSYWSLALLLVAIAIAVAFYFDETVQQFLIQNQNRTFRKVMQSVSRFGDWPEHVAFGLILAGIAWWRGSKKWTRIFLAMLIALALAGVVGRMIKISAGRARPSVKTEEVWNGPRFSSKYHAFPSGHVAASSAFFGILLFARRRIGLACMPIPIVIGFSRMYVAAHYLSDVVCAAVLGLICAWIVWRFALGESPIANSSEGRATTDAL
jgi:membrane-associated phospholipid phosphatase